MVLRVFEALLLDGERFEEWQERVLKVRWVGRGVWLL